MLELGSFRIIRPDGLGSFRIFGLWAKLGEGQIGFVSHFLSSTSPPRDEIGFVSYFGGVARLGEG